MGFCTLNWMSAIEVYWYCDYFMSLWMQKYQIRRKLLLVNYIHCFYTVQFHYSTIRDYNTIMHKPRKYIHIKTIYHIPCTYKRHPITHSHEWVNTVLFIGDSLENTDHVKKKLGITIRFASFSLSWIHFYCTAISSTESREVCFNILVWGSWCN